LPYISAFIRAADGPADEEDIPAMTGRMSGALRLEDMLVQFYSNSLARALILRLNRLLSNRLSKFATLWYADDSRLNLSVFSGTLDWRDPFSGEKRKDNIKDIFHRAVLKLSDAVMEGCRSGSFTGMDGLDDLFSDPDDEPVFPRFMDTEEVDRAVNDFLKVRG